MGGMNNGHDSMGHMSNMVNMHNTFWRDDQVTILFQSSEPLFQNGRFNAAGTLQVDFPTARDKINDFFREQRIPVSLEFLQGPENSNPMLPRPSPTIIERLYSEAGNPLPPGVYPFSFLEPIPSARGPIATSYVSFFQIVQGSSKGASAQDAMNVASTGHHGRDDDDDRGEDHDDDDDNGHPGHGEHSPKPVSIATIVNKLNEHLNEIYSPQVPITVATPHWLGGGTGGSGSTSQGCPLTPPMPVEDACSNYHIQLPDLSPELQETTGKGVTVFVLDAFPERGIIGRAARDAGASNPLLNSVDASGNVSFDYSIMSGVQAMQVIADTKNAFVGKDVYGEHYPILMADHGLFIAGIIHDLAPDAKIECMRVLDDLCVGDLHAIVRALSHISGRLAHAGGDLYGKPVVINMSLVIPTAEEAASQGVSVDLKTFNNIWASLGHPLLSLSQHGVVTAASAGNEGDEREYTNAQPRPGALFPAAFGNPPLLPYPQEVIIDGVIPVGAVDGNGNPTTYSCYPGPRGVATYGGEVPTMQEPHVPNPIVNPQDLQQMLRGIYSSVEFPPLSAVPADPSEQDYTATNESAWAYWVGTSFATPIVAAVAARIRQVHPAVTSLEVHHRVFAEASSTTSWSGLDSNTSGVGVGPVQGNVIIAQQPCVILE
jgi:subtilisin family serine protease